MRRANPEARLSLAFCLVLAPVSCTPRPSATDEAGPAPVDTSATPSTDTLPSPTIDTNSTADTSVATPPITPSQSTTPQDTPPAAADTTDGQEDGTQQQGQVSQAEYEGWRQYSVNCARCHGQDVLPNPVAANLLVSLGPGGPIDTPEKFMQVVSQGSPHRGMPAFKGTMSSEQIQATYAYVKARADKRIPPGRPARPAG